MKEQIQALDLFCGIGGLSRGCDRAGVDVIAGVDNGANAVDACRRNFDHRVIQCDLSTVNPSDFESRFGIGKDDVDVVVGGPPCQGFSKANVDRSVEDERSSLVLDFERYVRYYQPNTFIMENVKGIQQTSEMQEVFDDLLLMFEDAGYSVDWRILNAADFGVPQTRERVFVQGVLSGQPTWPSPTYDQHRSVSDVVGVETEMYQTAAAREWMLIRGERKMRRCDEPAYTLSAHKTPAFISAKYDVGSAKRIGDINVPYRRFTVDEYLSLQSMDGFEVGDMTKQESVALVGNAVPPPLGKAVIAAAIGDCSEVEDIEVAT